MTDNINRSIPPPIADFNNLNLPQPVVRFLDNGLMVSEINSGNMAVTRISFVWNRSWVDIDSIPSALTLCASMLREGTLSRSGFDISETLEYNGAWLTVSADRHSVTVNLYSLNSKIEGPLDILLDIIYNPTFPDDALAVYRERMAQTEELNRQKVSYLCELLRDKQIYGGDSLLSRQPTPDEIRGINVKTLLWIHKSLFASHKPAVFLSGRLSPDIESLIVSKLAAINLSDSSIPRIVVPFNPSDSHFFEHHLPNAVQSAINVSIPTITRSNPDYVPLRMLVILLGGFFGSRLMSNIREDKGYTYGINASLIGMCEGGIISINTQCANHYVNQVIEEIRNELQRLTVEGFTDTEISNLKRFVKSQLATVPDSPFTISDYHQLTLTVEAPDDYFEQQFKVADTLSSDLLTEMAIKYINPDNSYITIVGQF